MAEAKDVFSIPNAGNLDGLNMCRDFYGYLFEHKIDDEFRLTEKEDILLVTYPRTGTTWLSQIVSLMLPTDEKFEEVKRTNLHERTLYLEYSSTGEPEISRLHTMPAPRTVKTHLPYRFITKWINEDKVKTIITSRNPKDTLVSLFHFYKLFDEYQCENQTWDEFFDHVKAGLQEHGDQYDWLLDWSNNRDKGQLLFLKYEDMKSDIVAQIKKIAEFLNIEVSEERMEKILYEANIKQMKTSGVAMPVDDVKLADFVRSGQTGGWKKYFTVAQNEWFDEKYKKLYDDLAIDVHYE